MSVIDYDESPDGVVVGAYENKPVEVTNVDGNEIIVEAGIVGSRTGAVPEGTLIAGNETVMGLTFE
jgi:hypothetical protein